MTEFKQIIGRGTRVRDDYGKLWFNILDYTGSATRLFADPDFDGDPARVTEEEIDESGQTDDVIVEEPSAGGADTPAGGPEPTVRRPSRPRAPQVLLRRRPGRDRRAPGLRTRPERQAAPRRPATPTTRREVRTLCPTAPSCAHAGPTPSSAPRSSNALTSAASASRARRRRRAARRRPVRPALPPRLQRPAAHPPRARAATARRAQGLLRRSTAPRRGRSSTNCSRSMPSTAPRSSCCPTSLKVPPISDSRAMSCEISAALRRRRPAPQRRRQNCRSCSTPRNGFQWHEIQAKTSDSRRHRPDHRPALGALIKSARDIMRKDKGLNGDLDRLPMLTWIMFLKFLDDLEISARRRRSSPARSSARPSSRPTAGATGPPSPTASPATNCSRSSTRTRRIRPDGTKGRACSPICAACQRERRRPARRHRHRVQGRRQPDESGYLLRDVINKVSGIHFTSSDELHTLGRLYEIDAARDARRGRRLRRVLHPAPGRAVHGRGHRPAARRDRARPGLRHRRLPRRGLRPPRSHSARPSRTARVLQQETLFGWSRSRCPTCSAR